MGAERPTTSGHDADCRGSASVTKRADHSLVERVAAVDPHVGSLLEPDLLEPDQVEALEAASALPVFARLGDVERARGGLRPQIANSPNSELKV